jgi:8-oxo-dGTP pyrophosphatase MutT (NUDIX family)
MQECFGWPVVTAENCFEVIRSCGIKAWPQLQEPDPIDTYLKNATLAQLEEYRRFGPKSYVVRFENPAAKEPFNGFRSVFKPYAMVFALIDGMVPVTAEWKHGNDRITIVPVAGVPGKAEKDLPTLMDQMKATAIREWREETGTELESLASLGPDEGLFCEARKADMRYFPFVGRIKVPISKGPTKLDDNEILQMVLFPFQEWLRLIESDHLWNKNPDFGLEYSVRDITYRALRYLNMLQLV